MAPKHFWINANTYKWLDHSVSFQVMCSMTSLLYIKLFLTWSLDKLNNSSGIILYLNSATNIIIFLWKSTRVTAEISLCLYHPVICRETYLNTVHGVRFDSSSSLGRPSMSRHHPLWVTLGFGIGRSRVRISNVPSRCSVLRKGSLNRFPQPTHV